MTSRTLSWCAAFAVLAATSACADDEDPCPDIRPCDIRDDGCQERAARIAACLRGVDADTASVPVDVIDAETYIEEQVREAAKPEAQRSPAYDAFARALVLLGMADEQGDSETDTRGYLEQVGAFYSAADDRVTVLDHGRPLDDEDALALLVHEMTHALQAQEDAFASIREATSWDMWLARRAMTEGDATFAEMRVYAAFEGVPDSDVNWDSWFANYQAKVLERARESSDLFRDSVMLFPYAWGGQFVQRVYEAEGRPGVLALFGKHAPNHTSTVMQGDEPAGASNFDKHAVPSMADPWSLNSVSHLGAWLAQRFSERHGSHVSSFRVDALSVFDGPSADKVAPTAAHWRFELASTEDAASLASFIADDARWSVVGLGREVFVSAREASIAPDSEIVAWGKSKHPDLFFDDSEESSASLLRGTRYGCGNRQLGELPVPIKAH